MGFISKIPEMHKLAVTPLVFPSFITRWWPAVSNWDALSYLCVMAEWWRILIRLPSTLLQPSTPWSSCSLAPGLGPEYPKLLTLLFLWGRIWSERPEAEEAGNRASSPRSIMSTGRAQLTVFCGKLSGTGSGFETHDLHLRTFLERKKKTIENVNGCFLIQCEYKVFVRQWQSFYSSFELVLQMWRALYNARKGQEGSAPIILLLFASFIHLYIVWQKSTGDFKECVSEAYERNKILCAISVKVFSFLRSDLDVWSASQTFC